jgi:mannose-6-phosphate isomerase-like protein (cupin superfamily)
MPHTGSNNASILGRAIMAHTPVRRIVTGHDDDGKAIILEDRPAPRAQEMGGAGGLVFHEIWTTDTTPARIDRASGESREHRISLLPPANGTRIRVIDAPPDGDSAAQVTPEMARAMFAEIGAAEVMIKSGPMPPPHPLMHRTQTIDYAIILEGEMTLILDETETTVRAGDIVIQRGTSHSWSNRSDSRCRAVFVMIDGAFDDDLVAAH